LRSRLDECHEGGARLAILGGGICQRISLRISPDARCLELIRIIQDQQWGQLVLPQLFYNRIGGTPVVNATNLFNMCPKQIGAHDVKAGFGDLLDVVAKCG
jgi:hypothetical protein